MLLFVLSSLLRLAEIPFPVCIAIQYYCKICKIISDLQLRTVHNIARHIRSWWLTASDENALRTNRTKSPSLFAVSINVFLVSVHFKERSNPSRLTDRSPRRLYTYDRNFFHCTRKKKERNVAEHILEIFSYFISMNLTKQSNYHTKTRATTVD